MNAQEAKAAAYQHNTSATNRSLAEARSVIESAAKKGLYITVTYNRISADAKRILEAEGFKLREWDDQRDGYGCEISWQ